MLGTGRSRECVGRRRGGVNPFTLLGNHLFEFTLFGESVGSRGQWCRPVAEKPGQNP